MHWNRIPKSFIRVVLGTIIIGLIAHMMCFTNFWSMEDNSAIAYGVNTSLVDGAGGGRWLTGFFNQFGMGINIPWLSGIFSLFCFGVAVWAFTEVFDIDNDFLRIIIGGILVTSPSVTVEYGMIGNIGAWSFSHLFSGLAVYSFYKVKHGKILCFVLMFLVTGIYAPHILLSVSFILVKEILDILFARKEKSKDTFIRQLWIVGFFLLSMGGSYAIQQILVRAYQISQQERVSTDATENVLFNNTGMSGWIAKYSQCIHEIFYNIKLTLLKSKFLLALFVVTFLLVGVLTVLILVKNRIWRNIGKTLLLVIDVVCLPIAMNGMVFLTHTHKTMQFAFIMPWVYIIYFVTKLKRTDIFVKVQTISFALMCGLVIITLVNWVVIDNIAHTKKYAHYTEALQYANRLEGRLEYLDGYIPGETPVYFVGTAAANCYWRTDDFYMLYEWPGVGDCGFSSAYATGGTGTLINFITQHVGAAINPVSILPEYEKYEQEIKELPEFPQKNSIIWAGDTVVVNLGEIEY